MGASRRFWSLLLLVVLAGGALRWSIGEAAQPVGMRGDEVYYTGVARSIARGDGHRYAPPPLTVAKRPPAHPWVLSLLIDPDGGKRGERRPAPETLPLQFLLGTLLVLSTGLLGRGLFDERVGLAAAALAALNPTLIAFSHYYWSETLCSLLLTAGLVGVVRTGRAPGVVVSLLTGLCFGLGALTREIAIPVVLVSAAWLVWTAAPGRRRRALVHGVLVVSVAAAVVLPWTLRNQRALGGFAPVSTIGWFAIAEGNTLHADDWFSSFSDELGPFRERYRAAGDELERTDFAREWALERIRSEQPLWLFKKLARSTTMLLTPDSPLLMKLREGRYESVSPRTIRGVLVLSLAAYLGVLSLAALGFLSRGASGRRLLVGCVLATALATHVLANSTARFRVPWLPLGMVFAAATMVDVRGAVTGLSRRAWIALVAFALYFFAVCVPYSGAELTAVWTGPDPAAAQAMTARSRAVEALSEEPGLTVGRARAPVQSR